MRLNKLIDSLMGRTNHEVYVHIDLSSFTTPGIYEFPVIGVGSTRREGDRVLLYTQPAINTEGTVTTPAAPSGQAVTARVNRNSQVQKKQNERKWDIDWDDDVIVRGMG